MKKFMLWASTIALAGCCVHGTVQHPGPSLTFEEKLENQTIALTYTDDDGDNLPFCSGVWISANQILTANHCAEAAYFLNQGKEPDEDVSVNPVGTIVNYIVRSDFNMKSPDDFPKKVRTGKVTAFDRANDLALIKVDTATRPYAVDYARIVDNGRIPDGLKVNIVGHTVGYWWSYSVGYVSNTWLDIHGPDPIRMQTLQISSPAWHGNSGGGAFDDEGNLVGVSSWITKQGPNMTFFVHRDTIIKFLKTHKVL